MTATKTRKTTARELEVARRLSVRVQGLIRAVEEAEQGGATVMRIDHIRTLMDLPRPLRSVAS